MLHQENNYTPAGSASTGAMTYDAGLRAYMIRIFNTVAAGLALSGTTAYAVAHVPALTAIFMNPVVGMVTMIGLLLFLWFGMNPNKMLQQSLGVVQAKYYLFTALLGTTMAYVFLAYSGTSVTRVFLITAATFGGMGLIGYTTKRDLTGFGSFLMMGVFGLILAMLVNIFLKSTGLDFMISIIGVLLFTGLIAFETQSAKRIYNASNSDETNHKLAIYCALDLYLTFINLFQFLLRLLGNRN